MSAIFLQLFLAAVLVLLHTASAGSKTCYDVGIQVSVQTKVAKLPRHITKDSLSNFLGKTYANIINIPIKGTYTIRGTHCKSTVKSKNNNRLQFLVHGILSSRHNWSGEDSDGQKPYHGSNYSYVDYVTQRGYDTLAIDRLGSGQSDKPDPVLNVQLPAEIETTKSVLDKIKQGRLGKTYQNIIYVGQSYGSILGHGFAVKYPNVVNAIILNGWSNAATKSAIPTFTNLNFLPARDVNRTRFGSLPPGYLASSTPSGFQKMDYYHGDNNSHYDQGLARRQESSLGTVTVGELYTSSLNTVPASGYKGHVLLITGEYDNWFCARDYVFLDGHCGWGSSSIPAKANAAFPNANFSYHIVPNTGHVVQFHYTQQDTYGRSVAWIEKVL